VELINATRMVAGYSMGLEPSGRELLVVAVKGTFRIPAESGARLLLHEEQVPLVLADQFCGEPGISSPLYEVDFAPRKHLCDVVVNATAYAPGGNPVRRMTVGVGVGGWSKSFAVCGDRRWQAGAGGIGIGPATPFLTMPISYQNAYGGTDQHSEDSSEHGAFMPNPVGCGYFRTDKAKYVDGTPVPNTEEILSPVTRPGGQYRPMALGPIGRHWEPRIQYAGTYDDRWLADHFPFLPPDFDERYYQSAPPDQCLPKPLGEQVVTLINLTPAGRRDFILPHFEAPIVIFPKRGDKEELTAHVDTVVIEPDHDRVTMSWRAARPLKKNMFEIAQILVGRKGTEWWQQREQVSFPIPVVVEPMRRSKAESEGGS
jgi:hypothetical protein